jgi:hypothetical protein
MPNMFMEVAYLLHIASEPADTSFQAFRSRRYHSPIPVVNGGGTKVYVLVRTLIIVAVSHLITVVGGAVTWFGGAVTVTVCMSGVARADASDVFA